MTATPIINRLKTSVKTSVSRFSKSFFLSFFLMTTPRISSRLPVSWVFLIPCLVFQLCCLAFHHRIVIYLYLSCSPETIRPTLKQSKNLHVLQWGVFVSYLPSREASPMLGSLRYSPNTFLRLFFFGCIRMCP